jgi:hypothetical protein
MISGAPENASAVTRFAPRRGDRRCGRYPWLAKWIISYYNDTANKAMARDDGQSPRPWWAGE